jgi:hypothetical protein
MKELSGSGKVIAALTVLEGVEDPDKLLTFGPSDCEDSLTQYANVLKNRFSRGKTRDLAEMIRSWTEISPALPIYQIHPGWILELVRGESPRVIGLICRYLPGSHIRYLIENLPHEIRDKLPTLGESFALPMELMEVVKDFLARKFFCGPPPNPGETFSCRHIPWMSAKDLRHVIHELGYRDIRNAFAGVDPKAVQTFLTRFPFDEAKEIRRRLESGSPVAETYRKQAQEHIVSMNLDVIRAEDLPFEIGLSALAEAVHPQDRAWIEGVVVRLSPNEGYRLRRFVREALGRGAAVTSERRQPELLGLIRDLADQDLIAKYWKPRKEEEITDSIEI